VAGRFFGMNFQQADQFNAVHGNQFIADLMPKHPVYTAMLPESARAVIGLPHPSGRAAMRMLENEGFHWENYIDIFDGGPTMTVRTDQIRSIKEAADTKIVAIDATLGEHKAGEKDLVAFGKLGAFRAAYGWLEPCDGGVAIDPEAADLLGVGEGDLITHISRF
jgi:arginine N-succinyltransferase